jgi:hypothetical protein
MLSDVERELGVFPPPGDLWRKIAASKSVAAIIGADLSAADDAIVAELLPSLVDAARAITARCGGGA